MAIPYIDPQDLGDPNEFKLFASNIQTFKELYLAKKYPEVVELGQQLQEDLDNNPGWSKHFSITPQLTEATIFVQVEEGKKIIKDLKVTQQMKDLPLMEELLDRLQKINAYLEKEHYFTDTLSKQLVKYQKWMNQQYQKEKRHDTPPVNKITPINEALKDTNTNPEENKIQTEQSHEIELEGIDNFLEDEQKIEELTEVTKIISPPPSHEPPQTKKMKIPHNFGDPILLPFDSKAELDENFASEIYKELQSKFSHFKIYPSSKAKFTLIKQFSYFGVYFDTITKICSILLFQPVTLKGTLSFKSRITYKAISGKDHPQIKELLQTQILRPYTAYKEAYLNLEDNEIDDIRSMLEVDLIHLFRKVKIIATPNSFTIEYNQQHFVLDLRAYFILNGRMDYEGNMNLPGIPSIKMYFVLPDRREIFYQSIPSPSPDQSNIVTEEQQNTTHLLKKTQKRIDRFDNIMASLLFITGVLQISSYYFASIILFWTTLGGILMFLSIFISGKLHLNKIYDKFIPKPQSGILTDHPKKQKHIKAKHAKESNKITNPQKISISTQPLYEFGNQNVVEFLKD